VSCTTIQQLKELEIRIGNKGKKIVHDLDGYNYLYSGYGYFMEYDLDSRSYDITFCSPRSAILHGSVGPISRTAFAAITNRSTEFPLANMNGGFQGVLLDETDQASSEEPPVAVTFEAVKFNNDKHMLWDIDTDDDEDDDEDDDGEEEEEEEDDDGEG